MGIPESQLETWSHQGAIVTAKATHESIRRALNQYDDWPDSIDFEVYLQGSYKNNTNIRGDSDVDVVVQLNSTFRHDLSYLSVEERRLFEQSYSSAAYNWFNFRIDVLQALQDYYGASLVHEGKKSLKLAGSSGRLPADIIVCMQYRKYLRFRNIDYQYYVEGMTFYVPSEGRWVINYPKLHYDNGVKKNSPSKTSGWYKPVVRLFKNARTYLIDQGRIHDGLAPSYFLECLLFNVPDDKFGTSYQHTFCNVVDWLNEADFSQFLCQNEQLLLFGDSPEQWSIPQATKLIEELINLWNTWYSNYAPLYNRF